MLSFVNQKRKNKHKYKIVKNKKGILNPLDRTSTKKYLTIDSQIINNAKNAELGLRNHVRNEVELVLDHPINKVISMELKSFEMINTDYEITEYEKTNVFYIYTRSKNMPEKKHIIKIADGIYNGEEMVDYLNKNYFVSSNNQILNNMNITIDHIKGRLYFSLLQDSYTLLHNEDFEFDLEFYIPNDFEHRNRTDDILSRNSINNIGWIMGFKNPRYNFKVDYIHEKTITKNIGFNSEGIYNAGGHRYFKLDVNDFQNYFNNYEEAFPYDKNQRNNILCRLHQHISKMSYGFAYNENSRMTRYYKGPVKIERLEIKIINSLGDIMKLNNHHFTMCICFKCLV